MNICHIADNLVLGGLETYLATLLNKLAEDKNNNIHLITQQISAEMFDMLSSNVNLFVKEYCNNTHNEYVEYIKSNNIELINSHPASALGISIILKRILNIPVVFTYHGLWGWNYHCHNEIDKLITVSNEVKDLLLNTSVKDKLEVIQSGINTDLIFDDGRDNNIDDTLTILFSGRIDADKYFGIKILISALKQMNKDIVLNVAGDGSHYDELKLHIQREGVTGVVKPYGYVSDMNRVLNNADIVISTGRGIKEAMLCGKSCISMDCNSYDGIVNNENIKILEYANFSGRSKNKVTTSIEVITRDITILLDDIERNSLGTWCKEYALDNYTSNNFVDKHIEIYKNIINK